MVISLIFESVGFVGSVASLIGLAFMFRDPAKPLSAAVGGFIAAAVIFIIMFVALRVTEFRRHRPISLKGAAEIKDYLYQWISRGQRVAIFSRDLSWVDDDKMKQLLRGKAERQELELCLPQSIPLSDDLAARGAQVYTYPEANYVPGSRFTIINAGRQDAQVAIGRTSGDRHFVREISAGEDSLFAVANDLMEVIKRSQASKVGV